MSRFDQLPGPGDLRIPDPECVLIMIPYSYGNLEWCGTHDRFWGECKPDYEDEP